jgi:hypothetical protein
MRVMVAPMPGEATAVDMDSAVAKATGLEAAFTAEVGIAVVEDSTVAEVFMVVDGDNR